MIDSDTAARAARAALTLKLLEEQTGISPDEASEELASLQMELRRRAWVRDPHLWITERLGDFVWSLQTTVLQSVRDNRKTAVPTCHSVGKSWIAAAVVAWWLDVHVPGDAFVVTSAPTGPQVQAILWREIGRAHARGLLAGRVNQTEWYMRVPHGNEELVAFGRKPSDYEPTAFQGIHARHVLYVFDEACGMPNPLWEAADSLISNDFSKALVIGNPDDPVCEFREVCKPGSGWNVVQIGAFDTPNFTGEVVPEYLKALLIGRMYVEEKRRKWASSWQWSADGSRVEAPEGSKIEDTNPYWQSKILGRFPENADAGSLIPVSWIRLAQQRSLAPEGPGELGVDVGGGGDASTGCHRRGPVFRILWSDHNPDTMQTCGNVVYHLRVTNAVVARVDEIGIGRGVVDRAREQNKPVVGVNVGGSAKDPEGFVNIRAEGYWELREKFEKGVIDIDPNDDDLAAELASIRYKRTSGGKIQIESKDEAKRRGVPSPNRADALMLSQLDVPAPQTEATWGR